MASEGGLTLLIKNPARPEHVLKGVPLTATLAELKRLIYLHYPGNPEPDMQTLIYAGKVLKDPSVVISTLLGKVHDSSGPYSFHLVIRQPSSPGSHQQPAAAANGASTSAASASTPTPSQAPATAFTAPAPASSDSQSAAPGQQQQPAPVQHELPQVFPAFYPTELPVASPTYGYFNPIVANAYQAAYAAALAAGACVMQQQQSANSGADACAAAPSAAAAAGGQQASTSALPGGAAAAAAAAGPAAGAVEVTPAAAGAAAAVTALGPASPWATQSLALTQAYLAALNAAVSAGNSPAGSTTHSSAQDQQQQQYQRVVQLLMGSSGMLLPVGPSMVSNYLQQQQMLNMLMQHGLVPSAATTTITINPADTATLLAGNAGLRQRRMAGVVNPVPAAGGAGPAGHRGHHHGPRPRARQRVFTLRISMRALLQSLVFLMVMYQHFTWRRCIALLLIGLALWVTSLAPLRRFIASLQAPPAPGPALRPAAAAPAPQQPVAPAAAPAHGAGAAAGNAPAAGAAAAAPAEQAAAAGQGAAADGAAAAAPVPAAEQQQAPNAQLQRPARGLLGEVAVVVVGFITSLLPAWNYDPADAAAFAAAQAFDDQERAQQQRQAAGAGPRPRAEDAGAQAAGGAAAGDAPAPAAGAAAPHQD